MFLPIKQKDRRGSGTWRLPEPCHLVFVLAVAQERIKMSNRYCAACLCGTVRFHIDGVFERFYLCHCDYCRKDTGSAHAANLFSSKATLSWTSGREETAIYTLPGTRHTKCFCSICGSALPYSTAWGIVVPAGCLDREFSGVPDAHVFTGSRARWDRQLENLPAFPALPS